MTSVRLGALSSADTIFDPYRLIYICAGRATTAGAVSTKYAMMSGSSDQVDGTLTSSGTQSADVGYFYFAHADYDVSPLTQVMYIRGLVLTSNTAPAVTITFGLYPVTITTGNIILGTVVTGSTIAFTTPGNNTATSGVAADFTIPADGAYCMGYTLSGTPSGNMAFQARVFTRLIV